MAMQFKRFASFADMQAFAIAHAKDNADMFMEAGIYTDNNGLSHRPQIVLVCKSGDIALRWNAYADEANIDFMSKRQRVEARESSESYIARIREARAFDYLNRLAENPTTFEVKSAPVDVVPAGSIETSPYGGNKPYSPVAESRPYLFSELTEAEKSEVTFRGFPRGADIRYIANLNAAESGWQLVKWTRVIVDNGQDMPRDQPIVPREITWDDIEREFPGAMAGEAETVQEAAKAETFTIIFRVIDGDVYEVPTCDHASYADALAFVLDWFGFHPDNVIVCDNRETVESVPSKLDIAVTALESVQALLSDWPTMRALSAIGAEKATANKKAAQETISAALAAIR